MGKPGRKPRAKKGEANAATAGILDALKFCEPASRDIGAPNQTHIRLGNHWAVAFDGVIAIGHKIDSDIVACPHTKTLITALSKCTDATQITQLGDGRLSVKSGHFQSFVPCLQNDLIGPVAPDAPCANISAAVTNALAIVGPVAQENAQRILLASVLLRSGSAIATDGVILMESWHGIDLPTILLPKSFITVLSKIAKAPVYFGFSPTSATFYFDDQSWIRSQLYVEPYPNLDRILNTQANPWPIPAGLWDAINKISDLGDDSGHVFFGLKSVRTAPTMDVGAICEIEGSLPDGLIFDSEDLQMIGKHATTADFQCGERRDIAAFFGPNFRAFLMQMKPIEPTNQNVALDRPVPF